MTVVIDKNTTKKEFDQALEEARERIKARKIQRRNELLKKYSGILKDVFADVDPVEYQRKLRDEWD